MRQREIPYRWDHPRPEGHNGQRFIQTAQVPFAWLNHHAGIANRDRLSMQLQSRTADQQK
jgi:hypothetical protein